MSWNEKEYTETNGEWVWLKGINTFEKTKKQKTQNKQKKKMRDRSAFSWHESLLAEIFVI